MVRTNPRAPARIPFPRAQTAPPGLASARLSELRRQDAAARGGRCQKFTSQGEDRGKDLSLPGAARASATKKGSRGPSRSGAGSRALAEKAAPRLRRRLLAGASAQRGAGPRRGREAGTGPREAEPWLSDLTPPAPGPKPAPPVQAGWQRSPSTDLRRRARAPRCRAAAQTRKVPGGEGTQMCRLPSLPVRRQTAGTRCCRRCGPSAPSAGAQPAAPWPSSGQGAVPVSPLLGGCSRLPRGLRGPGRASACGACACGAGRRGAAALSEPPRGRPARLL